MSKHPYTTCRAGRFATRIRGSEALRLFTRGARRRDPEAVESVTTALGVRNHCGRLVRGLQGVALWAGLFLLLIVDTLQILRLVMPPGAVRDRESRIGFAVCYSI